MAVIPSTATAVPPSLSNPPNPNPSAHFPPSFCSPAAPMAVQYSAVAQNPNPNPHHSFLQVLPPMGYGNVPQQPPVRIHPAGMPSYPSPYPMYHPGFPPRPIMGLMPQMPRPPIPGIRGILPVVTPLVRPVVPIITPEKPQTTVWVGKIAPTVDNEFILSVLKHCGPVKSWKRPQGPDCTLKSFGFCEFESAEGVLRALRLLNKLEVHGQELMLNINVATKKYLKQYVEKKTERDNKSAEGAAKVEPSATSAEDAKNSEDSENKEKEENDDKFGLVTDDDHEADRVALEKIKCLVEERSKNKSVAPPPKVQAPFDASPKSNSDFASKLMEEDSDIDTMKNKEKNDDEIETCANKPTSENIKTEISSPDKARRQENRTRDRDRGHVHKTEKERELERVEREREREKTRREREREYKIREAEQLYKDRLRDWEAREREKEHRWQYEKEREKVREWERRMEIIRQEEDSDYDDSRKRKRRSNTLEEKRIRRQREKEEDMYDKLREEEEKAEAERRAAEEQKMKDVSESPKVAKLENINSIVMEEGNRVEMANAISDFASNTSADNNYAGNVLIRQDSGDDVTMSDVASSNSKLDISAPAGKLGFGLVGSGKRTTIPSVFHEEDMNVDDKKIRPLVPIDYSAEELQAVQTDASGTQLNLVTAAQFVKRLSGVNSKEENLKKERTRRSVDKSDLRERDQSKGESGCSNDHSRDKVNVNGKSSDRYWDREYKAKAESKKLLDAKQLIDMIPKTRDELFVYKVNWEAYDVHQLHERMKPWISKKITEFLGEEEATLVDYIMKCIKEHVRASKMLELLQAILDEEAEMFVLKMWRMLIFEIKKVETSLTL